MSESLLGQPIKWNVIRYAHQYDFDHARVYGGSARRRVEHLVTRRSGVVWTAGPVVGTAWVIPDEREPGEGYAVCVQICKNGAHVARPTDVERSSALEQGQIMARRRMTGTGAAGWPLTFDHLARGAAPVNV